MSFRDMLQIHNSELAELEDPDQPSLCALSLEPQNMLKLEI